MRNTESSFGLRDGVLVSTVDVEEPVNGATDDETNIGFVFGASILDEVVDDGTTLMVVVVVVTTPIGTGNAATAVRASEVESSIDNGGAAKVACRGTTAPVTLSTSLTLRTRSNAALCPPPKSRCHRYRQ
jgi:hypothetical protein